MTISEDEEDQFLAEFLESEILSDVSDQSDKEESEPKAERVQFRKDENEKEQNDAVIDVSDQSEKEQEKLEPKAKRVRFRIEENEKEQNEDVINNNSNNLMPRRIESGSFSKIPPELFPHILKFLSSEDLIACALVCKFLNYAASDESLWRRLYCLRWGLLPPSKNLTERRWKKLYFQRDEEDMVNMVRNCPPEFKEYYIQMQAAKRSQAPLPSQIKDDQAILDKTVAEQVALWKRKRGLTDKVVFDHACSGETCSYYQIGDVFVCEKTGNVHVCDETCREVITDPTNEHLVCTVSGQCFGNLLSLSDIEQDEDQQQGEAGVTDEAEPFMGSGRFARAYLLGYNCDDEKELEAALRFC